jgi:hypothetical protein
MKGGFFYLFAGKLFLMSLGDWKDGVVDMRLFDL